MRFNIIGRKIDVTDQYRDYIEKKIGRLDKFFRDEAEARIVIGPIKENEYVEASVYAAGMIYRAEVVDSDVMCATDKIVDIIERTKQDLKRKSKEMS